MFSFRRMVCSSSKYMFQRSYYLFFGSFMYNWYASGRACHYKSSFCESQIFFLCCVVEVPWDSQLDLILVRRAPLPGAYCTEITTYYLGVMRIGVLRTRGFVVEFMKCCTLIWDRWWFCQTLAWQRSKYLHTFKFLAHNLAFVYHTRSRSLAVDAPKDQPFVSPCDWCCLYIYGLLYCFALIFLSPIICKVLCLRLHAHRKLLCSLGML